MSWQSIKVISLLCYPYSGQSALRLLWRWHFVRTGAHGKWFDRRTRTSSMDGWLIRCCKYSTQITPPFQWHELINCCFRIRRHGRSMIEIWLLRHLATAVCKYGTLSSRAMHQLHTCQKPYIESTPKRCTASTGAHHQIIAFSWAAAGTNRSNYGILCTVHRCAHTTATTISYSMPNSPPEWPMYLPASVQMDISNCGMF